MARYMHPREEFANKIYYRIESMMKKFVWGNHVFKANCLTGCNVLLSI